MSINIKNSDLSIFYSIGIVIVGISSVVNGELVDLATCTNFVNSIIK